MNLSNLSYNIHMDKHELTQPKFRPDRLANLLERKGLTLGQLEYLSGVSTPMLSHLARGTRPGVSATNVAKIAQALEVSIEYLLDLTDDPRPVTVVSGAVVEEEKGVYHVLSDEQQTIIEYISGLADDEQKLVRQLLEALRKHNTPRMIG